MLLQKNLSRKISPEKSLHKNRSIFGLKNQSCDRRQPYTDILFQNLNLANFGGRPMTQSMQNPEKRIEKVGSHVKTVGTCQKHFYDSEKKRICTGIVMWTMPEEFFQKALHS